MPPNVFQKVFADENFGWRALIWFTQFYQKYYMRMIHLFFA